MRYLSEFPCLEVFEGFEKLLACVHDERAVPGHRFPDRESAIRFERMAIVGDAAWMGLYAKIVDPITKPDIKHFTLDQRDETIAWIRE